MPIYRLFKNEAFQPEAIDAMTDAYTDVCRALGVTDNDQIQADMVAKTVIEFAQRGVKDSVVLRDYVLQALRT